MTRARTRLRAIGTLIAMCWRPDPWRALLAFLPIYPLTTGITFLSARRLLQALPTRDRSAITVSAIVFTAAWAIGVVLGRKGNNARVRLQELTRMEYERRLMGAVSGVPEIEHIETAEYLDSLHILRSNVQEVLQSPRVLGWLIDGGGGVVVSALLLVSVQPALLLMVLAGVPAAVVNARAHRRVERVRDDQARHTRRAAHLFDIATSSTHAKEVRVCRLEDELLQRYAADWRANDRAMLRVELRASAIQATAWVLAVAAFVTGLAVLLSGVRHGDVHAGDIFLTLGVMTGVVNQIGGAANGVSSFRRAISIIERLVGLEDIAAESRQREAGKHEHPPARLHAGIELVDVSFRYPNSSADAVHRLNLRVPAGSVVALVGDNGAGKSTLVKLLFGLYRPTEGRITVDGIDLEQIPIDDWRHQTSACFQDFLNIELIAQHSIGVGDLPHLDDEPFVTEALSRAAGLDVLERLPDGLQTRIGTTQHAVELSGGQWQKLAIGRAMTRQAALLVGLDEPTSAIDPLSELAIFDQYATNARDLAARLGTVTVLVSHRFSTVHSADLIVVLREGRIAEIGSHDELIAADGAYAELYNLQARHYR